VLTKVGEQVGESREGGCISMGKEEFEEGNEVG
jgi:hypothetical protein